MAGGSDVQSWRLVDAEGVARQAPFLWRVENALDTEHPELHNFLGALQFTMECALLQHSPATWLRCQVLHKDLDASHPRPYRLYHTGLFNQWVLNRNLVLGAHADRFNHRGGIEVVLIVEDGPTEIELQINTGVNERLAVSSRRSEGSGPWVALVLAELHSIVHRVTQVEDIRADWGDRWSISFYMSAGVLGRSRSLSIDTAISPPMNQLATIFKDRGLPAMAHGFAALQEGGWLASRYEEGGDALCALASSLGVGPLSRKHSHASGTFRER